MVRFGNRALVLIGAVGQASSLWSSNLREGFADSSRRFSKTRKVLPANNPSLESMEILSQPAERTAARKGSSGTKLYVHLFRNDGGKAHLRGEDDVVPCIVHSWSQLLSTATKRLNLVVGQRAAGEPLLEVVGTLQAWAGKRVFAKHDGAELFSIEDLKQLNERHHGAEVVVSVGEAFKSASLNVRRCKSKLGHAGGAKAVKVARTPRTPRELWHATLEPSQDTPIRAFENESSSQSWSPEFADEGEGFEEQGIDTLQNTRSQLYATLMQSRRAVRHDNFI